jgi:hypothetical protein
MGAALLAAGAAWADETWKTDLGVVEWEKDVDGAAVFKLNLKGGKFVRFYIENLKADGQVRGAYSGYWINTADENMCPTQMTAPDGTKSKTWGTIELTFVKPSFPSDWTGRMGKCFDKTEQVFNGISLAK